MDLVFGASKPELHGESKTCYSMFLQKLFQIVWRETTLVSGISQLIWWEDSKWLLSYLNSSRIQSNCYIIKINSKSF